MGRISYYQSSTMAGSSWGNAVSGPERSSCFGGCLGIALVLAISLAASCAWALSEGITRTYPVRVLETSALLGVFGFIGSIALVNWQKWGAWLLGAVLLAWIAANFGAVRPATIAVVAAVPVLLLLQVRFLWHRFK